MRVTLLSFLYCIFIILSGCSGDGKQPNMDLTYNPPKKNINELMNITIPSVPELSPLELRILGKRIFNNEGAGNIDNLVHWNDGEDFASLGIGHFTWYPANREARFGNTFPELLDYIRERGIKIPTWLPRDAPWNTREELIKAKNTPEVQELNKWLYQTHLFQVRFIVDRTRKAIPKIVDYTTDELRPNVINNLNAIVNTPGGWYAIIDYINFKGEGLNRAGGYNSQNWGLLQVLEEMQLTPPGEQALHKFADSAIRVLERRVKNSPPDNNEQRWMAGWSNRVNSYRNLLI